MLDWLDDKEPLRNAIRALVAEASRLDIAVAFWGATPHERLPLDPRRIPLTRIIANVASGGTNPAAIRDLLRMFGSDRIRQLDDLHAKVFLSDTHLIAGSANVSANGLGLEGNEAVGWREVCVRTNAPSMMSAAQTWFENQWNTSRPITETDLAQADEAWRRARRTRPFSRSTQIPETDGLLTFDRDTLKGRRLFIVISSDPMSTEAKRALVKEKKIDPGLDGYEDWSSMPLDATLIDFAVTEQKNGPAIAKWGGMWETPADRKTRRARTIGDLILVRPAPPGRAMPIDKEHHAAWERDIQVLTEAFRKVPQLLPKGHAWDDWCLPIEEAWTHLHGLRHPNGRAPSGADDVGALPTLIAATDDEVHAAIRAVSENGQTFTTVEVIRHLLGGRYVKDGRRFGASRNTKFGQRLSRHRDAFGIRLIRAGESYDDPDEGPTTTHRWALEGR